MEEIIFNEIEYDKPYIIEVDEIASGTRIDKFIADYIPELSRSYIQKLIKDNYIKVNDKLIKSNYKVCNNDKLMIIFPKPKPLDIQPENIDIDIVYEDEDIIIINKAKNMVVHPAPGHYSGTLVNALLYHCGNNLSGINGILRPGIVHRIDKDTTGLLMVCKNDLAHQKLALQLSVHSINRRYQALTYGNFTEDEGTINKPIARGKVDRKVMAISSDGKEAITHYKVLGRYCFKNRNLSYIECKLETGRTHQIRLHMASTLHPLVGDCIYGYNETRQLFNTRGQMLHAKTLGFVHPTTNEYIEFDSELPEYFNKILVTISNFPY